MRSKAPATRERPGAWLGDREESPRMTDGTCSIKGCTRPPSGHGWCKSHYGRWYRTGSPVRDGYDGPLPTLNRRSTVADPLSRFLGLLTKHPGGCWLWEGTKNNQGYGWFWSGTAEVLAHRWSYEHFIGPIPRGLVVDHLRCDTKRCVNPDHLQICTRRENNLRADGMGAICAAKTECLRGHPFTPENTYVTPQGDRTCRTCKREKDRRWQARRRFGGSSGGGVGRSGLAGLG